MPPNHQAIIIWWSSQGWHILCFTLVFGRFEATKLIGFLGQSLTFCWKSQSIQCVRPKATSGFLVHLLGWFFGGLKLRVEASDGARMGRTAVSETQPWAMKLILHLDTKEITCYRVLTSLLEPLCVKRRRELLGDMLLHVVVAFSDCLTQIRQVHVDATFLMWLACHKLKWT